MMTEKDIQRDLRVFFCNFQFALINAFVYSWESDFFAISKSGYATEVEIKISKADFKKDFGKEKHFFFENHNAGLVQKKDLVEKDDRWGGSTIRDGNKVDYVTNSYIEDGTYKHVPYCKFEWFNSDEFFIPNRFYYACPLGIITKDEAPKYAGLLHIVKGQGIIKVKDAPFLHKRIEPKLDRILLEKFWWLSENQRRMLKYHNIDFKDCYDPSLQKQAT